MLGWTLLTVLHVPMVLWLTGAPYATISAVLALAALILLTVSKSIRQVSLQLDPGSRLPAMALLPYLFIVVIGLLEWFFLQTGKQGLDFAIFVQAIDSASKGRGLLTSLVGIGWHDYLTHHFAPIFYLPAVLASTGLGAFNSVIIVHLLVIALALWGVNELLKTLSYNAAARALGIALLCLCPGWRVGLSWEVRDELYVLWTIPWAFVLVFRGRIYWGALCFFICTLGKETFFYIVPAMMAAVVMLAAQQRGWKRALREYWIFAPVLLWCAGGFALYFSPSNPFFIRTFTAQEVLPTFDQLFDLKALTGKAKYLLSIFVPFWFAPLFTTRGRVLLLPLLASLAGSMLANLPNMYNVGNYYGAIPTLLMFIATAAALSEFQPRRFFWIWQHTGASLQVGFFALLFSFGVSLSFVGAHRPAKLLREMASAPVLLRHPELQNLAGAQSVAANHYDLPLLIEGGYRIFALDDLETIDEPWDYIVVRRGGAAQIPHRIRGSMELVSEAAYWSIYRRKAIN